MDHDKKVAEMTTEAYSFFFCLLRHDMTFVAIMSSLGEKGGGSFDKV